MDWINGWNLSTDKISSICELAVFLNLIDDDWTETVLSWVENTFFFFLNLKVLGLKDIVNYMMILKFLYILTICNENTWILPLDDV